jgi:hypothetical protein
MIVERELHRLKQYRQIVSREEGIETVESNEQSKKAPAGRRERLESDSNVIVERDSHPQKQ